MEGKFEIKMSFFFADGGVMEIGHEERGGVQNYQSN
jgi:hypothetical protein